MCGLGVLPLLAEPEDRGSSLVLFSKALHSHHRSILAAFAAKIRAGARLFTVLGGACRRRLET